jgi:NAD(P)-dependent dehydrogenase (short-subunit alcohol dehydrogenase family)
VRQEDSIRTMVKDAAKAYPRIDILSQQRRLQRAEAGRGRHMGRLEPDSRHESAGHSSSRSPLREMIPHGRGRVINIGSVIGDGVSGLGPTARARAAFGNSR